MDSHAVKGVRNNSLKGESRDKSRKVSQKEEKYMDIEDLLKESLSDQTVTGDKEDLVLEYLCQTIAKTDTYDVMIRKAKSGDSYALIQLASWHIAHAKNIRDYCAAYTFAIQAARKGYVEANYILGQLYLYGTGCEKNVHRAVKCLSYFIKNISRKELLNDCVLEDAYIKLAEAEKQLKHFDKTYFYLQKLASLDAKYEDKLVEFQEETKEKQREYTTSLVITVITLLAVIATVYLIGNYMITETKAVLNQYEDGPKVTAVDTSTASYVEPEKKVSVQLPVSYALVSETDFNACNLTEITVTKVISSSEFLSAKGTDYSAANLVDHDSNTVWQEGAQDCGVNQSITFSFEEPAIISAMRIENGKQIGTDAFLANNRLASFRIFGNENLLVEIPDTMIAQYIVFENPILDSEVEIVIDSVFGGSQFNDTCISEISFYE